MASLRSFILAFTIVGIVSGKQVSSSLPKLVIQDYVTGLEAIEWPKPTDTCKFTNCGPPANVSVTPWPPVYDKKMTFDISFFAAHDIYDGIISLKLMKPIKLSKMETFCDEFPDRCPVLKGDKLMATFTSTLLHTTPKGRYVGEVAISNVEDQLVFCAHLDCYFK